MMRGVTFFLALAIVGAVWADDLVVMGNVENGSGTPIEAALVTVALGGAQGQSELTTTTNADGDYLIETTYDGLTIGGGLVGISVVADGYEVSTTSYGVIENPNDGTPDTVTADFVLQATGGEQPQGGDSLYVNGTVTDHSDGSPLQGVAISVTLGIGGAQVTAVTDENGDYSIATLNEEEATNLFITASLDGYAERTRSAQVNNPSDGTPDEITRDFTLSEIVYDTVTITATVKNIDDSTAISGASVLVSYSVWLGGRGGLVSRSDTGYADDQGIVDFDLIVSAGNHTVQSVNWEIAKEAYQTESGLQGVVQDSVNLGTVYLTKLNEGDSLTYTISGSVVDENGEGVRGQEVIVEISQDGTTLFVDTVTTTRILGLYTATTTLPYTSNDLTVTVTVEREGYNTATESANVTPNTQSIGLDIALVLVGTRVSQPTQGLFLGNDEIRVEMYTLNGRLMGVVSPREIGAIAAEKLGMAKGPIVLRYVRHGISGQSILQTKVISRY